MLWRPLRLGLPPCPQDLWIRDALRSPKALSLQLEARKRAGWFHPVGTKRGPNIFWKEKLNTGRGQVSFMSVSRQNRLP